MTNDKGSFDGIANKFDKNIYGTTKGKLRHSLLTHYLSSFLIGERLRVVDVGGGTGMMAAEFAKHGHEVLNLDVSNEALVIAQERLAFFENAKVLKASLFDWRGGADLVICHAVLEWLEQPLKALDTLLSNMSSGTYLSLSFFNYHAMFFNNVLYGNFDYINRGMKVRNQVRLNPHNPVKPEQVIDFFSAREDAEIVMSAGIRCFHDYIADKPLRETAFDEILRLEKKHGQQAPYKHLAKYFYLQVRKV